MPPVGTSHPGAAFKPFGRGRKLSGQASEAGFDGKAYARRLPTGPGVYVMRGAGGEALYVGKAANLRKRVASYFDARPKIERIMNMVAKIGAIEVSLTRSEGEALLLENEWIKSLRPRYNVLLRDDKSYPWLMITSEHPFPRVAFHRGARSSERRYFGPYPSARSVRESINLMQKIFRIRNCEDSVFAHRSRPCLQYQIRRCTAPCVNLVSEETYRQQIEDAILYLTGDSPKVIARLISRMEHAANRQDYEQAATLRDQIHALKRMQAGQLLPGKRGNVDVLALAREGGAVCVQFVSFRGGRNIGERSYFPSQAEGHGDADVLQAFLGQFYRERLPAEQLIVSHPLPSLDLYERVFSERAGRRVAIQAQPRGPRRETLLLALRNARAALQLKLAGGERANAQREVLQDLLGLDAAPEWIECFDISHFSGGQTVGACVAFDPSGPVKSRYRRYSLRGLTSGDDYAAMEEVLRRRYRNAAEGEGALPDLVLVDGGRGQLARAKAVFDELGLPGLNVLGIAKGAARRAGHEEWITADGASLRPGPESPASHLVQKIRDEAHRFAITGHRGQRSKASVRSELEEIPGVGAARRRNLLTHFGGIKGVKEASAEQLASVPGISLSLAQRIFKALH